MPVAPHHHQGCVPDNDKDNNITYTSDTRDSGYMKVDTAFYLDQDPLGCFILQPFYRAKNIIVVSAEHIYDTHEIKIRTCDNVTWTIYDYSKKRYILFPQIPFELLDLLYFSLSQGGFVRVKGGVKSSELDDVYDRFYNQGRMQWRVSQLTLLRSQWMHSKAEWLDQLVMAYTRRDKRYYHAKDGLIIDEDQDTVAGSVFETALEYYPGYWVWKWIGSLFGVEIDKKIKGGITWVVEEARDLYNFAREGIFLLSFVHLLVRLFLGDSWFALLTSYAIANFIRIQQLYA
jgi:hypothetical protein